MRFKHAAGWKLSNLTTKIFNENYRKKIANQGEVLRGGISRIYISYQTNGNHATEPSAVGHVNSKQHWKSTFGFTETVNSYGLK